MKKTEVHGYAIETEDFVVQEVGKNPRHRDSQRYGRKLKFVFDSEGEAKERKRHIAEVFRDKVDCYVEYYGCCEGHYALTVRCYNPDHVFDRSCAKALSEGSRK